MAKDSDNNEDEIVYIVVKDEFDDVEDKMAQKTMSCKL